MLGYAIVKDDLEPSHNAASRIGTKPHGVANMCGSTCVVSIGMVSLCALVISIAVVFRARASSQGVELSTQATGLDVVGLSSADVSKVYFGCGCFWHVQYAFVHNVEMQMLGRTQNNLTAFTGYAGGKDLGAGGHVCYHNMQGMADYGELGHAEVVSLALPVGAMESVFAFFLDNVCVKGVRRDTQDQGAEYRSIVGFPGGIDTALGRGFEAAANKHGIKVQAGNGDEEDTYGTIYVMDSLRFPFHQAEVYHQFHNDMMESYGRAYNELRNAELQAGRISKTGCPE